MARNFDRTRPVEVHVREASEMEFAPGQWPTTCSLPYMGLFTRAQFVYRPDRELEKVIYLSTFGEILFVYND